MERRWARAAAQLAPDAHAEGPTPISAVLSGLLLNVALYSIIRCKVLADGALDSRFAGNMMMGFGLLSVVVAAFFLSTAARHQAHVRVLLDRAHGAHDVRLRHGGPIAIFAGLLT
jgi:hydrogenase-4 component F